LPASLASGQHRVQRLAGVKFHKERSSLGDRQKRSEDGKGNGQNDQVYERGHGAKPKAGVSGMRKTCRAAVPAGDRGMGEPKDGPSTACILLITQCNDGIDARGAARGEITGQQDHCEKKKENEKEGRRVVGLNFEEHTFDELTEDE
jgi:hypothetical protein